MFDPRQERDKVAAEIRQESGSQEDVGVVYELFSRPGAAVKRSRKERIAWVTGAAGFVGANLSRAFAGDGYRVFCPVRATSDMGRFKNAGPCIETLACDLTDRKALSRWAKRLRPEVIVHAASVGIYGGENIPERDLFWNNVTSTLNLLEAVRSLPYRAFLNTGSSSEYGPKQKPMRESDAAEPVNLYGVSKLASTVMSQQEARVFNKPIVNFRLFSPYGPWDDLRRLIPYAVKTCLQGGCLELGDKTTVRDYVFIEDCCDLYLRAAFVPRRGQGQIFNVGSGRQRTTGDVVGIIVRLAGDRVEPLWGEKPSRPFDKGVKVWQADIRRVRDVFGWVPKTSLRTGLKRTIDWFAENMVFYR
jgi:nucleoside-diphosphate-sugar epimerase